MESKTWTILNNNDHVITTNNYRLVITIVSHLAGVHMDLGEADCWTPGEVRVKSNTHIICHNPAEAVIICRFCNSVNVSGPAPLTHYYRGQCSLCRNRKQMIMKHGISCFEYLIPAQDRMRTTITGIDFANLIAEHYDVINGEAKIRATYRAFLTSNCVIGCKGGNS